MSTFWKRQAKVGLGEHGRTSEKRIAKALGGKLTTGSGNKQRDKGDIKLAGRLPFRIECKATTAVAMPVKLEWLAKIWKEAFEKNENPMLIFSFVAKDGKPLGPEAEWCVVPRRVMEELLEKN